MPCPILLVDDEPALLRSLAHTLQNAGMEPVDTISDSREVMAHLRRSTACVILLDLTMPYISGQALLGEIVKEYPEIPIIILTADHEVGSVVQCMRLGAFDYLTKPLEGNLLVNRVQKALELRILREEVSRLGDRLLSQRLDHKEAFSEIVTRSPRMFRLFQYLESIASSEEPVLISGETGTGKELVAQALHRLKGAEPFVAENVAGLDDTVFADALFGHVKGAFTGADIPRKGMVATAGHGTLLLDEIGDLSATSQVKLLRLIQERSFSPIGSDTSYPFKAHIMVTTNRDLEKEVSKGRFRADLYYRLAAHKVHIPPLRERREDIPLLVSHFLEKADGIFGKDVPAPRTELYELLARYPFPGNVRELRAMIFDAAARYKGHGPVSLAPFRDTVKKYGNLEAKLVPKSTYWEDVVQEDGNLLTLKEVLKEMEWRMVDKALERANGNQSRAAAMLGISRQSLNHRLRKRSS